jgi:hypothetical protein
MSTCLFASAAHSASTTYTTDADFALGTLNSVNFDAPNSNQLQLNTVGDTFPVLWVANAGEDTVSRVNTDGDSGNGCEEARYLTAFGDPNSLANHGAFSGPAPSRSAVDSDGNLYVANRNFTGGRAPELLKIAVECGDDRNGNGVIDTSSDLNGDCMITPDEMLPVIDDNGDGVIQVSEYRDERIIWVTTFGSGGQLGRSLCLDTDGDLWAGTYSGRQYWKFDRNGSPLAGPITTNATNYGCAVDADGTLWGASLGSTLVEVNTNTDTWTTNRSIQSNYGIALGNGKVYLGSTLHSYDPSTGATQTSIAFSGTGVQVDGFGNVWFGTPTLRKFTVNPTTGLLNTTPECSVSTQGGRGPIVGKGNNIWTINTSFDSVSQYDNDCNFISTVPVGRDPYTYSDATGFGARTQTDPSGIWTIVTDGGAAGTEWDSVDWNGEAEGNVPTGASIEVEVRAADNQADLGLSAYAPVANGATGLGITGQFLQVRAVLRPNPAGDTPVLSDLSVNPQADIMCDANTDSAVNILDIRIIGAHRNTPALSGDPLDIDGNGVINRNDARKCVLECDNARCAI